MPRLCTRPCNPPSFSAASTARAQSASEVTSCRTKDAAGPSSTANDLALIVQHVADHHLRTLRYQQAGLRGTLAARPAAHEHHLVVKACHVRSPRLPIRRVWQFGRLGGLFEGAAPEIIFKTTAMR